MGLDQVEAGPTLFSQVCVSVLRMMRVLQIFWVIRGLTEKISELYQNAKLHPFGG
jgi:hypothetical protein